MEKITSCFHHDAGAYCHQCTGCLQQISSRKNAVLTGFTRYNCMVTVTIVSFDSKHSDKFYYLITDTKNKSLELADPNTFYIHVYTFDTILENIVSIFSNLIHNQSNANLVYIWYIHNMEYITVLAITNF